MKKILSAVISTVLLLVMNSGCSRDQMAAFQQNDQEPAYNLLKLFDGFPALHSAIDSLDSQKLNDSLGDMLINGYDTPQFLRDASDLVQAPFLVPMIGELHGMLKLMMDTNDYHYKDSGQADKGYYDGTSIDRLANFYSALDQVVDNTELSGDILAMASQVVDYLVNEKDPAEIEENMGNMMKVRVYLDCMYSGSYIDLPVGNYNYTTLTGSPWNFTNNGTYISASSIEVPIGVKVTLYQNKDLTGTSISTLELTSNDRCLTDNAQGAGYWNDQVGSIKVEYDISKLAKLLGKVTMSCDYPMWVNTGNVPPADRDLVLTGDYTRNTDLGNAAKGLIMLLYGLNQVAANDSAARNIIDNMIQSDLPALLNSSGSYNTIKTAIINASDLFAPAEFETNTYSTSSDYYNASNPYVNASLKETIRDILPNVAKLLIRDDDSSANDDTIKIFNDANGRSPVEALAGTLKQLKDIGIDYSQSANELETSLRHMVEYNAFGEQRSSASYKVSYLDHLLYTIGNGYYTGYLTRTSCSGEPYNNFSRGHGAATGGILTINDSMYSLTSHAKAVKVAGVTITTLNSYQLALNVRTDQGDRVWRRSASSSGFTYNDSNKNNYRFYLGYDYPPLLLLPESAAGDAGIPNGGQTAVIPTSDETTVSVAGAVSQNDYRTYFPKVADGKGMLNTALFMMSWIARTCWDGQGPYYYADPSATQLTINGHTGYAFYKPNGELYALVDKSAAPWVYYYPPTGNDAADSTGQRANRYKDTSKSDYFMVQNGNNSNEYTVPPMQPGGSSYAEATSGSNKFRLTASTHSASYFQLYEKVQEWTNDDIADAGGDTGYSIIGNTNRECSSQEEAMYRNYQWLLFEKKFMFPIPMNIFTTVAGCVQVDSAAYVLIEANGLVGMANGKKNPNGNGYWNIRNCEGAGTNPVGHRNNPDYGDSLRPGDSRIIAFVKYFSSLGNDMSPEVIYNDVLGNGHVLPDIVGANISPVARLGFNEAAYFGSDFTASGTTWDNRNKILPVFVALAGFNMDGTVYDASGSGYNYNYNGNHKYPLAQFLEGVMIPLSKPLFRYYTDSQSFGGSAGTGRWVPRMEDEDINNYEDDSYDDRFSFLMPDIYSGNRDPNYRPRSSLRTLMSVLVDGSISDGLADGMLPLAVTNTHLVSGLLSLLQQFSDPAHDAARPYIFKGLEQLVTAMKVKKSEVIGSAGRTSLDYTDYAWMFNTSMRDEDINLEELLGYEGPFKTGATYAAHNAQWTDFQDTYNMLASFVGGSRDITPNLVNIVNAVLAQPLTEEQVHGLLYTAGKLFARHDPAGWHYQGYDHGAGNTDSYDQLLDLLTYLPLVHDIMKTSGGTGEKYERMLRNVDILLKDNSSLLHYAVGAMTTPYSMQYIIEDLDRFLGWSIISDPNSPLWDDLVLMLDALADMNDPRTDISVTIKNLGFQAD